MKNAEELMTKAVPTDFDIKGTARLDSVVTCPVKPQGYTQQDTYYRQQADFNRSEELSLLREQNSILRAILEKDLSVIFSDDDIGRANARYEGKRGLMVNEGGFKNAY